MTARRPVRVIITGDRHWTCHALAVHVLDRMIARHGQDITIVQGAAAGVDHAFVEAAYDRGLGVCSYPADWEKHGRRAGPLRNAEMVQDGADFVLAVHRDLARSKGTKDCVRQALAAGLPVYLIDSDAVPCRPRRLGPADVA